MPHSSPRSISALPVLSTAVTEILDGVVMEVSHSPELKRSEFVSADRQKSKPPRPKSYHADEKKIQSQSRNLQTGTDGCNGAEYPSPSSNSAVLMEYSPSKNSSRRATSQLTNLEQSLPKSVQALLRSARGTTRHSQTQKMENLQKMERNIETSKRQIAALQDLKIRCTYDGEITADPSEPMKSELRPTTLQLMFLFYSARQDAASSGTSRDPTFDEIERANTTMSLAELIKWGQDWMVGIVCRDDLYWAFRNVNTDSVVGDDVADEMDYLEFSGCVVRLAILAYWDQVQKEFEADELMIAMKSTEAGRSKLIEEIGRRCVEIMSENLMLHTPGKLKDKLDMLGKVNAGFGAWLPSQEMLNAFGLKRSQGQQLNRKIRRLKTQEDFLLPKEKMALLTRYLQSLAPRISATLWKNFQGPYIAMRLPCIHPEFAPFRFRIEFNCKHLRNKIVHYEFHNLPCAEFKYSPKPMMPGMSTILEMICKNPDPGEYLGFVLTRVNSPDGPELFRIPVYLEVYPVPGYKILKGEPISRAATPNTSLPPISGRTGKTEPFVGRPESATSARSAGSSGSAVIRAAQARATTNDCRFEARVIDAKDFQRARSSGVTIPGGSRPSTRGSMMALLGTGRSSSSGAGNMTGSSAAAFLNNRPMTLVDSKGSNLIDSQEKGEAFRPAHMTQWEVQDSVAVAGRVVSNAPVNRTFGI